MMRRNLELNKSVANLSTMQKGKSINDKHFEEEGQKEGRLPVMEMGWGS